MPLDMKRQLIDLQPTTVSIAKQYEWLSLNHPSLCYTPSQESAYNLGGCVGDGLTLLTESHARQ